MPYSDFREDVKYRGSELRDTVWYSFLVVVAVVVVVGGLYVMAPAWLGLERNAIVNSNAFVQSRQGELLRLQTSYDNLQVQIVQARNANDQASVDAYSAQQRAIANQIRQIESTMNQQDIPAGVTVR